MSVEDRPTRPLVAPQQDTGVGDWLHTASLGGASSIHAEDALPAVQLPDYEILGQLGRGGMGVVLKARQLALNRVVAVKMLYGNAIAAEDLARFRAEAQAVARLQHPHIVQIYEIGDLGNGLPFLALEYVAGGSLQDRLRGEPQPPVEAAALVETLARAVYHAHQQGVVHRDLKPANILLAVSDQRSVISQTCSFEKLSAESCMLNAIPKITDFGLAKRLDDASGQTKTGDVLGTPSYMAPEQAGLTTAGVVGNAPIGPPADIYALGAILYEMLTGRPPFKGVGAMETIWLVLTEEVVPPRKLQPKVPRDLETICLKCLDKNPSKRYDTALSLAEDLRRFQAHEPIQARSATALERALKWGKRHPTRVLILALAVAALGRVASQYWWNHSTLATAQAQADNALRKVDRALTIGWDSLQRLAETGDHAAAAAQTAKLLAVRTYEGEQLWRAAGVYARCALVTSPQRAEYLSHALALLRQAHEKGALTPNRIVQVRQAKEWEAFRTDPQGMRFLEEL